MKRSLNKWSPQAVMSLVEGSLMGEGSSVKEETSVKEEEARSKKARLADGEVVEDVVTLLTSCQRDTLVNGHGDEVPVSFLKGKDVGFYFYTHSLHKSTFKELVNMSNGTGFEFVVVYFDHSNDNEYLKENFYSNVVGTTVLTVPFARNFTNKRLYERFNKLSDPYQGLELVIVQAGENIAHTFAMYIFHKYGIEAYPFSKSRVTEIEVARFKSLTLDEVLFSGRDYKFVINRDGQEIPVSRHLVGKKVLLFLTTQAFADLEVCRDERVIAWYNEIKENVEAFEMIRVLYNYDLRGLVSSVSSYKGEMPWLEFPYNKKEMNALGRRLLPEAGDIHNFLPMFATFGRDGRFITMKSFGSLIDSGKADYCSKNCFDDVYLYGQVRDYVAKCNMWSTVDEETGECYVPW